MKMIPMLRVQHLLDQAAQPRVPAHEARLWRYRHGVAMVCAGVVVALLGPMGVQQVPDCGAPHATVLRSGWMFRVFPHHDGFALACTPVEASDNPPRAFFVPVQVLQNPNSAFGATQDLWSCGIPLDSKELL